MKLLTTTLLLFSINALSAQYFEQAELPDDYSDWTSYRVDQLNKYASKLLKEDQSKDQILKKYSFLDSIERLENKITIEIRGEYSSCFYEEGTFDRDLYWDDHLNSIKKQVQYTYQFLKKYYLSTSALELNLYAIEKVEICTKKRNDSARRNDLSFRNGVLTIFLDKGISPFESYKVLSPFELEKLWNQGPPSK